MLFSNKLISDLVIFLAVAFARSDDYFVVDIMEYGVAVQQEVKMLEGLQIIHVPSHRHLEEVYVYIDFENHLELVKLVQENKCQLSNIIPGTERIAFNPNQRQVVPLDAATISHSQVVRLESSEPMANVSYLRAEMQEACQGWPVFWVENVEEGLYNSLLSNFEDLTIGTNHYELSPFARDSLQCRHDGGMLGSQVQCHPECFYQLCNPNGGHWCYYSATHCPMVTTSCWQHLSNIPLACRPCCSSNKVPCRGSLQYCGCYKDQSPLIG